MNEFVGFQKIPRYSRKCIVTEKIDGANAQILIEEDEFGFIIGAGSRTRWLTTDNDNFGFAKWVLANREELKKLGPGRHFGEWWGHKIQRGYGVKERFFSLFNVIRWNRPMFEMFKVGAWERAGEVGERPVYVHPPACCDVVPIIGVYDFPPPIESIMDTLKRNGSYAGMASGFSNPEGVVIYHVGGNLLFKKTLSADEEGKGGK